MSHTEIKQITSRNVSYQIELMEWSKKMDLIAISTKGDVIIHRFKWQKVWSYQAPSENLKARSIAWRNDEKMIAVGYNNGLIVLLDIENKEEVYTLNMECSVSCMLWTNCSNPIITHEESDSIPSQFDQSKFLPPLPSLNSMSSTTKKNDYNTLKFYSNDTLNLLVIGLENAKLNLSIFGMITCANIDLKPLFNEEESIEIKDLIMSNDLKQIFVVVRTNNSTQVLIYQNSVLSKYSVSLFKIALQHGYVKNTLSYIKDTIQSITEAWETVLLEMDNKLIKFADSQPPGTISSDFLELLMFGYPPTTALHQFLTKDLTEKGLKKLANSIELSYSTIQKLVVKPLTDLLDESIDEAVSYAGSLLIKAKELQQTIETSMRDYKIFFRWLYAVIVRLMDETVPDDIAAVRQQEINYLAEFLRHLDDINEKIENEDSCKRKFNLERVGQYIEDKNLVFPFVDDCPNSWKQLLEANECLKNCPNLFPHDKNLSLLQQFNKLSNKINQAFSHPQTTISKGFELCKTIINPLTNIENLDLVHATSIYLENEKIALFVILDNNKEFTFIETDEFNCVKTVKLRLCTPLKEIHEIIYQHLQFYNESTLSILLSSSSSMKNTCFFMQFPIMKLRELAMPYSNGGHMRVLDAFEVIDETLIKQIDGIDGIKIAVSGPRKVCSILSQSKKSIKIYEMEIDEEDEELLESSNNATLEY
uniref:Anaphase-promoting complex subunit 4 n=1 Tax=Culicoides sonorensis TaxID=179676 RepID=A0A336MQA3_CULSO